MTTRRHHNQWQSQLQLPTLRCALCVYSTHTHTHTHTHTEQPTDALPLSYQIRGVRSGSQLPGVRCVYTAHTHPHTTPSSSFPPSLRSSTPLSFYSSFLSFSLLRDDETSKAPAPTPPASRLRPRSLSRSLSRSLTRSRSRSRSRSTWRRLRSLSRPSPRISERM